MQRPGFDTQLWPQKFNNYEYCVAYHTSTRPCPWINFRCRGNVATFLAEFVLYTGGQAESAQAVSDLPKSESGIGQLALIELKSTKIEFRARIFRTTVASTDRIKVRIFSCVLGLSAFAWAPIKLKSPAFFSSDLSKIGTVKPLGFIKSRKIVKPISEKWKCEYQIQTAEVDLYPWGPIFEFATWNLSQICTPMSQKWSDAACPPVVKVSAQFF